MTNGPMGERSPFYESHSDRQAHVLSVDAALSWTELGFAVFPLKPRGKTPLGSLVPRGFLDASRDPAVIRDWWKIEPHANIGIVTGGGNFVVDLDDASAVSWFTNACVRHG